MIRPWGIRLERSFNFATGIILNWLFRNRQKLKEFVYFSGDGLDPTFMEGKDRPVDFPRAIEHVKAANPNHGEDPLDAEDLLTSFNDIMDSPDFTTCGEDFRSELK